jgi:hypothetical protein
MSCFIVSDYHVNALVSWADLHDVDLGFSPAGAAELLTVANRLAYADRYNSVDFPLFGGFQAVDVSDLLPIEVIKACNCLGYQASDWAAWNNSLAADVLRAVKRAALAQLDQVHGPAVDYRKLPSYDAAAWELVREEVQA